MAGRPPESGEPDPTVDLGSGTAAPATATGPDWWRRRPVQIGMVAAAVVAVLTGVLLARAGSEPAEPVSVPDVVGLPLAEAVAELGEVDLDVATELVDPPEGVAPGTVVDQEPVAGSLVEAGGVVSLRVAGRAPDDDDDDVDDPDDEALVEVPEVVGLGVDAATAALADEGFDVTIERVAANGVTPGTVLDQDPPAGTALEPGSVVVLHVARETDDDDDDDGPVRNVIAWILGLGPSAPSGPSDFQAYERVRDLECATLLDQLDAGDITLRPEVEQLYRGAGAACLAAFEGETDRWGDAEAALDAVLADDPALHCFDVAVHDLLDRLVTAFRDEPDGEFVADTDGGVAGAPPCPTISALEPDRGPLGTEVTISGDDLDHVHFVDVYVDGEVRYGEDVRDDDTLRITVDDRVGAAASVCVALVIEDDRWGPDWPVDGQRFTIERDGDGEPDDADCPPPTVE